MDAEGAHRGTSYIFHLPAADPHLYSSGPQGCTGGSDKVKPGALIFSSEEIHTHLANENLHPSPDIYSGSFQQYYFIIFFLIITLQLLGLIMYSSIKSIGK